MSHKGIQESVIREKNLHNDTSDVIRQKETGVTSDECAIGRFSTRERRKPG